MRLVLGIWVWAAAFLFSPILRADKISETEEEEVRARKDRASGHSIAPVVGYEPVYKFVFGAAYFSTPSFLGGLDLI